MKDELKNFTDFGHWKLSGERVKFVLNTSDVKSGLYILTLDKIPVYVGKFENSLKSRMIVISNPPKRQATHHRIYPQIYQALLDKKIVETIVWELKDSTRQEIKSQIKEIMNEIVFSWRIR